MIMVKMSKKQRRVNLATNALILMACITSVIFCILDGPISITSISRDVGVRIFLSIMLIYLFFMVILAAIYNGEIIRRKTIGELIDFDDLKPGCYIVTDILCSLDIAKHRIICLVEDSNESTEKFNCKFVGSLPQDYIFERMQKITVEEVPAEKMLAYNIIRKEEGNV